MAPARISPPAAIRRSSPTGPRTGRARSVHGNPPGSCRRPTAPRCRQRPARAERSPASGSAPVPRRMTVAVLVTSRAQAFGRAVRAALLHEAHASAQRHHHGNDHGGLGIGAQEGQQRQRRQQQVEGVQVAAPQAQPAGQRRLVLHLVRAVARQAAGRVGRCPARRLATAAAPAPRQVRRGRRPAGPGPGQPPACPGVQPPACRAAAGVRSAGAPGGDAGRC